MTLSVTRRTLSVAGSAPHRQRTTTHIVSLCPVRASGVGASFERKTKT